MAKLSIGIDLSGRTITNSAASGLTITASKTIASTHSGNYIAESSSGAYYHANGEDTYFYDTGTNLGSFDLPENFGVIIEVDESSVFFDYLTRVDNEKTYVLSEDNEKVPFEPYKVPIDHADASPTYGAGNASKYGHVKLSDATNSTSGASGGTAATPKAVKAAYDLANGKSNSLAVTSNKTSSLDVYPESVTSWSISVTKAGYTPLIFTCRCTGDGDVIFNVNTSNLSNGSATIGGLISCYVSSATPTTSVVTADILWVKN